MAKIKLSEGGYTPIPEGTHIFKITKVTYDEDFGKLEAEMIIASGQKHTERFSLIKDDGEINEGALNAFSYFAKTALNDYNLDEVDHNELVGKYIKADVTHNKVPSKKDPKKMMTFSQLGDKYPADGFDESETDTKSDGKGKVDLDAILG